MSQFKINSITDKSGTSGPVIAGVSTNNSTGCMIIPAGPTENRGGRGRMVIYGGSNNSNYQTDINLVEIATIGDATDFGDLVDDAGFSSGMASATRGVFKQGRGSPGYVDTMRFVTFSSLGGITDFGDDLGASQDSSASSSNGVRGIFGNGTAYDAAIRSINIASTGNSEPFGTLGQGLYMGGGSGGASPTRGFFFGGRIKPPSTTVVKDIESVSFASGGAASKFGELTVGRRAIAAVTNNTRAVACSGDLADGAINVMDYITMASEGNATDFGDIQENNEGFGAGGSSATRGLIVGCDSTNINRIDYITIATTGNATDFGDSFDPSYLCGACSDSHGGLGE